ncbi:MAG: sortase [Anaerolineales bacterium]|nr:sortase [Anaerolineales bacterium]
MRNKPFAASRLFLIVAVVAATFLQSRGALAASLPAEINKQFTPLQIDAGGVSVMRVTIFNPNVFQLTNASWADDLIGVQPGLFIANPAGVVTTCGGSVTAVPGTTNLSLSGGTVPPQVGAAPGECYVEVNISSVTAGNLINTIPANNLAAQGNDGGTIVNITNTTPASATITVIAVAPPSLSKGFAPNTIFVGGNSVLTITLNNNDADTNLTGASYTDTLPAGLQVAAPNGLSATNCGPGVVAAPAGGTTISLTNGTITPAQNCVIAVNVTGVSGQYTNTIPAGPGGPGSLQTNQGVTNGTPASANLNIQPVGIIKSFSPGTVDAGDISNLTITLQNPTGSAYTGVSIADNLTTMGTGYTVAGAPTANTCGGTINAPISGTSIILTGGIIPASGTPPTPLGTCVITIPIQTPLTSAGGTVTNTIPANTLTADQPVTNFFPATAPLTVNRALVGAKSYSPTTIVVGGTSTVTITLTNRSSTNLTGVTFTDTLPANVTVGAAPASPQCGGIVTNAPNSVTLTGGTIPANGNCTIVFTVTSNTAGTYDNSVGANTIANSQGVGHASFSTSPDLVVVNSSFLPVGLSKSFQTTPITPGQSSRLRITITAPADTFISGINITDNLPAGLVIAPYPPATAPTTSCPGGSGGITAVAGTSVITFTNTAANVLAAGASCNIDVWVTSNLPNSYTNTIPASAITTIQGRTNINPASATIRVTSLTASKAFYPTVVQAGGLSTMTITLQNTTDSPLINVALTDNLPGTVTNGIRVAPTPNATTTCGGLVTAAAGSAVVSLTGGMIPAQVGGVPGLCTISVDVQGLDSTPVTPTSYTNTIPVANVSGTVQSSGTVINPTTAASAVLNVQPLSIGIVKGFNPVLVYGGAYSTMSIDLINPNALAVLTGISFTDDMTLLGAGMQLANPVVFNTGACGGTLTGNPGDTSFSFSGGTLAANSTCTLTLRVVMTVNGNRTNRIPAGAVTTFNGVSNPDPTEASLTNLPGVSVNKSFNPAQVLTNQPSTLTITIRNTSNVPVVNMGLADNLPGTLPDGLEVANPANATNTCGGTLTAVSGSQTIQLTGGSLAALGALGDTCIVTVDVISTRPGVYLNTIPAGALTADGGVTNNDPATDTLTVNNGIFSLGNRVWFDTDNNSAINGAEVGVNGVTVQLYAADAGGNPTGPVLSTTSTAGGGYYRFDNLPAGDYVVVIPSSQFGAGGVLQGYWSSATSISGAGAISETAAPDPDTDTDNDDNGTRQTGGAFSGAVISNAITLGISANEPTNDNDPSTNPEAGEAPNAQSNRTVDFGFYRGELGNLVYVDANGNGTFDAGDTPLPGATVQLFASNGTTGINVGADGILGTADDGSGGVTTGAGGTYQFSGLPAGDYIVRVTPPAGYLSTVDTAVPADSTDPDTNADNNDNGVGTAGGAVSSNAVTLTPGFGGASGNNTVTDATGATYDPTLDFGFTAVYSLGNRVWLDDGSGGGVANDGLRNGGEPGINNVIVNLYRDSNDDGLPDGGIIATDTTDANGYYRFDNLSADTYIVEVVPPAGLTSTVDAGDPDTDVDDDDDNGVILSGSNIRSNPVTLGPGTEPTGETNPAANPEPGEAPDDRSNRTVDFGFVATAGLVSLGSTVFSDINGNGIQNIGETGIAGVVIELYLSSQTPGVDIPIATDTTDLNGDYFFGNLMPGSYIVYIPTPPAAAPLSSSPGVTDTNDNSEDGDDNGIQTASGQPVTAPVILLTVDGETTNEPFQGGTQDDADDDNGDMTVDFGFVPSAVLVADPAIAKSASPSQASVGDTIVFTLTVTNTGNAPADNVVVVDQLLPIFDVTGVTSVYQAGGNAGTISISPAPAPFTVTVSLGTLDITDVVIIQITTVVNALGNPPITNTGSVTTTSLTDLAANNVAAINLQLVANRVNGTNRLSALPATGFAPNVKTEIPHQPRELTYTVTDIVLEIPSLGVKLPIVGIPKLKDGSWDVTWLSRQAGWLEGTAFPSWQGNSVLTSHVYLSSGLPGPFMNLDKLKYGDKIIIHAFGERYIFEVRTNAVVNPSDTTVLKHEESSWLTLMTCKEYDEQTNTYKRRVIVRAALMKVEADK